MILSNSMHKETLCIISSDWDTYLFSPYVLVRKTSSFGKKKKNGQGLKKVKLYLSLLFRIHWGLCSVWISETPDFLGLGPSISSSRLLRSRPHCVRPLEGKRRGRTGLFPASAWKGHSIVLLHFHQRQRSPAHTWWSGRGHAAPPPGRPWAGAGVICPSLPLFFSSWEALLRELSWCVWRHCCCCC